MPYTNYLEKGLDGRAPSLRQKLRAGRTLHGLFLQYNNPSLMELAGYLDYDWVFIDAEHGSVSVESVENMVRAAEQAQITPIVRVPSADPHVIQSYLDTGAMGLLVPHLDSVEKAKHIIEHTKYAPLGRRGTGSKSRANNVGYRLSAPDHFAWANEEIVIMGMLEDIEGVHAIKDIMAVPGIDGVVIGPTDLSGSMGLIGQNHSQEVQDVVENVTKEIQALNKLVCRVLTKEETAVQDAARLAEQGVPMLVEGLMQTFARGARGTLGQRKTR